MGYGAYVFSAVGITLGCLCAYLVYVWYQFKKSL